MIIVCDNMALSSFKKRFSKFSLLKMAFWLIIILSVISVISVLYLHDHGYMDSTKENNSFSESIFSNSLGLIFSIIGFLVALVIFLVQYIGSKFNSHELEKSPVSNVYFIVLLFTLTAYIAFNFVAVYLELIFPYTLISLILSFSVLLLVGWTVLYSLFYLDVSNVIENLSDQTTQFIKKKKKFKKLPFVNEIGYSDEFISTLNKKTSVFVKTSIEAINKNQDKVLKTSLDSLKDIAITYLEQSDHIHATEDKFLNELNDQFNFIISEGLKSYNQKILENIAETIGEISLAILEYRKGIGDINNFALNWTATLKDLFIKSYHKDRTIVCHICLEKINAVILLALDKGYYRSYDTYRMFLDDISEILSKVNQHWAAILLQKSTLMYQKQFLKFLELAKNKKYIFSEYFIKSHFDTFVGILNESKVKHTSMNNTIIFASLYGLETIAQKIAATDLTNITDEQVKRGIASYLNQLIEFNKTLLETHPEKNDYRIYDFFSEMLFLINKYVDLNDSDKISLIETLSNLLLDFVEKTRIKALNGTQDQPYQLDEATIDYFALLIYLHSDNPQLIEKVIKKFVGIYLKIKKTDGKYKKRVLTSTYEELKLYSCWIEVFDNLRDVNVDIKKILKKDYIEPQIFGRAIPSFYEQHGYPRLGRIGDLWYLHPSYMWGNSFQAEISNKLNGNNGKHYIEFNKQLKS